MKRDKLNISLYSQVELTDINGFKVRGWFVKDPYKPKKYAVLLLDRYSIFSFSASEIKSIQYLNNNYILKWEDKNNEKND